MSTSRSSSKTSAVGSIKSTEPAVEWCETPEFIYGGPFIKSKVINPFLDTATPRNIQLQGTFKKSFAYYSLKERLPIILTKVIDYCSREGSKIKTGGASDQDIRSFIQYVSKLKNDLVTNKPYDKFTVDTADAKKWNVWLDAQQQPRYFTNTWVFTECYVYRRLREGCELAKGLNTFDPFEEQKAKSFADSLELMCLVADRVVTMLPQSEKDKRKADFMTLLKICLWANKCDLSLTAGEQVTLSGEKGGASSDPPFLDPFQMIIDLKDKLLVDDSGKIADRVVEKAEAMGKAIEGNTTFKFQCSCHRLATLAGMPRKEPPTPSVSPSASVAATPAPEEEAPKIPCPAKMTIAQTINFDIICDNAGYELFADLCLAHFLISQKIVQKIRFHVKNMPWFVSDATPKDFRYVIDSCANANFNKTVTIEPKPATKDTEATEAEQKNINADNLRSLGAQWSQYLQDGSFELMWEDFWTWPHVYKDMKQIDYNMYRKLQYACGLLFKGDLNYRKLLGEKNVNPYTGFEACLQGFIPAPIIAVRTVKADLICGMPKGKYEQLMKLDEKWMEKGDYGVIQYCPKAEALKPSTQPCIDYGTVCFGAGCPIHSDM